mgnify:CR=1 FL=1
MYSGTEYNNTVLVGAFGDHVGPFGAIFSAFRAHCVAQKDKIGAISGFISSLFWPKMA